MRAFYDSLPDWAQYTFWGVVVVGGVLIAAVWLQNERDNAFDAGRYHAVEVQRVFAECQQRNIDGWVAHYHRPADTMTEVDLDGVAYTCGKYAEEQVPR